MSALDEVPTQADVGRQALGNAAKSAIQRVPQVVAGARDEAHREAGPARGHARDLLDGLVGSLGDAVSAPQWIGADTLDDVVRSGSALIAKVPSAIAAGAQANRGARQASGIARDARRRLRRQSRGIKSTRRMWLRRSTTLLVGIGIGVIVMRVLKVKGQSIFDDAPASSTVRPPQERGPEAYHTSSVDPGGTGGVYHDREDCPAGQRILPEHRVSGTGGRNRCKDCESLVP